jgi:Ca2+-binding EF-hand superfamily protein
MGNHLPGCTAAQIRTIGETPINQSFFTEFVVDWSLSRVMLCAERYRDDFFLTPLFLADVQFILTHSVNDTKCRLLFDVLNERCGTAGGGGGAGKKATCDGLALLGGLAMSCRSHLVDRLKFAFSLYDFDGSAALTLAELTMMIRTTLSGMAALAHVPCPPIEDLLRLSKQIFAQADISHDDELTLDEFMDWAQAGAAKEFLDAHCHMLRSEIAKVAADPNSQGQTHLSAFELAEEQFLNAATPSIDLSQKYLGDDGLSYFIEDMRSHAKHATIPITTLLLQGNGISSRGFEQLLTLLTDAAADRYGPLGAYLGHIEEVDVSGNARIANDVSPAILTLVNKCPYLTKLNLSGTKISRRMQDQIAQAMIEKHHKNKGVDEAKMDKEGGEIRAPETTARGVAAGAGSTAGAAAAKSNPSDSIVLLSRLRQTYAATWKKSVKEGIARREKIRRQASANLREQASELHMKLGHQALENKDGRPPKTKTGKGKRGKFGPGETARVRWQSFADQGNIDMYSESVLMERERLRNNPEIIGLISHWWDSVILAKYDRDHDDQLNKTEYFELHRAIGRALSDPNAAQLTTEQEIALAEEDWVLDVGGGKAAAAKKGDGVTEERFIHSIFELADQWTDSTDVSEYIAFLEFIFTKIYEFAATDGHLSVQGTIATRQQGKYNRRGVQGHIQVPEFLKRQVSLKDNIKAGKRGAMTLSEEMLHELRVEFCRYAEVHQTEKLLNYRHFRDALQAVGLVNATSLSNRIFEVLDKETSGFICWHEFLVGASTLIVGTPRQVIRLAFRMFDISGNGAISYNEVKTLLKLLAHGGHNEGVQSKIVEKIARALSQEEFRKFDGDGSQALTMDEFEQLCWAHPELTRQCLGVDVLDREEFQRLDNNAQDDAVEKHKKLEAATALEEELAFIDRMDAVTLLGACRAREGLDIKGVTDADELRKRLKAAALETFTLDA